MGLGHRDKGNTRLVLKSHPMGQRSFYWVSRKWFMVTSLIWRFQGEGAQHVWGHTHDTLTFVSFKRGAGCSLGQACLLASAH